MCLGYLHVPNLLLSFPPEGTAKNQMSFFVIFKYLWREVWSRFLKFQVQIAQAHSFQGMRQILKLDLQDIHGLSLLLAAHLFLKFLKNDDSSICVLTKMTVYC